MARNGASWLSVGWEPSVEWEPFDWKDLRRILCAHVHLIIWYVICALFNIGKSRTCSNKRVPTGTRWIGTFFFFEKMDRHLLTDEDAVVYCSLMFCTRT